MTKKKTETPAKVIPIAPSEHARFSPSASARWVACPGSIQLIEQLDAQGALPPDQPTRHSDRGSLLHAAIAQAMTLGRTPTLEEVSELLPLHPVANITAQDVLSIITQAMNCALTALSDDLPHYTRDAIRVEQRVEVDKVEGLGGTADLVLKAARRGVVLDWKFGSNPVDAVRNQQLMIYALAAFGSPKKSFKVKVVVVQQDVMSGQFLAKTWEPTPDELRACLKEVKAAVRAAGHKRLKLNPGPEQCQWCRARVHCPAIKATVSEVSATHVMATEPDRLAELYVKAKYCANLVVEIEKLVLDRGVDAGIPGFRITQGRQGARKWADASMVEQSLLQHEAAFERKLKSPTQLEKSSTELYEAVKAQVVRTPASSKVECTAQLMSTVGEDVAALDVKSVVQ